jgi:hypothetical protein
MAEASKDFWTPVGRSLYFSGEVETKEGANGPYDTWEGTLVLDLATFTEVDKALWASLCARVDELSKATFGKAWKDLPQSVHKGIRKGSERAGHPVYEGDTRFLKANTTFVKDTKIIAADKTPLAVGTPAFAQYVYHGAYARYKVQPTTFEFRDPKTNITSKGIKFYLVGAQFFPGAERMERGGNSVADAPEDDAWLTKASGEALDDIGF